jgi:signal transduction histidine kinase
MSNVSPTANYEPVIPVAEGVADESAPFCFSGHFLPRTLFGRLWLTLTGLCLVICLVVGFWFHYQIFRLLDQEASRRLEANARFLAGAFAAFPPEMRATGATRLLESRFGVSVGGEWIQNAYWLGLEQGAPAFIASFSVDSSARTVVPPGVDDVEDLMEETLAELEAGRPGFPDPFHAADPRRFKIVLIPLQDEFGLLSGIIGLEADLEYLSLPPAFRRTLGMLVLLSLMLSAGLSWLLASSFTRRIQLLLEDIRGIAGGLLPPENRIGIWEFDRMRDGVRHLGAALEEKSRRLKEFYEEKLSELSFTGGAVAHEIRNPLSAMEVHLGLIKRRFHPQGADLESFLEIAGQIEHQKKLVERFLTYSRKVAVHPEVIPLRRMIESVLSGLATTGDPFSSELDIPDEAVIHADPLLFRQILDNLLTNARTAAGDRASMLIVTIRYCPDADVPAVEIADNGPGVPADLVPRLFTPFCSGRAGGHGIGLALVRKLVEAHEGNVVFRPSSSGGACFILSFPRKKIPSPGDSGV